MADSALTTSADRQSVGAHHRIGMRRVAQLAMSRPATTNFLIGGFLLLTLYSAITTASLQQFVVCKEVHTHRCLTLQTEFQDNVVGAIELNPDANFDCFISNTRPFTGYKKFVQVAPFNKSIKRLFCKSNSVTKVEVLDETTLQRALAGFQRVRRDASYSPRGRFRGQTQSQYLAIDRGGGKDEGKAEAHSAADSSRATVIGNSGMGQAQSQSMYDPSCEDCVGRTDLGVESLKRRPDEHSGRGFIPGSTSFGNGPSGNGGVAPGQIYDPRTNSYDSSPNQGGSPGVPYGGRFGHPGGTAGFGPGKGSTQGVNLLGNIPGENINGPNSQSGYGTSPDGTSSGIRPSIMFNSNGMPNGNSNGGLGSNNIGNHPNSAPGTSLYGPGQPGIPGRPGMTNTYTGGPQGGNGNVIPGNQGFGYNPGGTVGGANLPSGSFTQPNNGGGSYGPNQNAGPNSNGIYPTQSGTQNGVSGPVGTGAFPGGSNWPTGSSSFVGPDGLNYFCCVANPSGPQIGGSNFKPPGTALIPSVTPGSNEQYSPGVGGSGTGAPYGPGTPFGPGQVSGQFGPGASGGQYTPGTTGGQGSGGQYGPGTGSQFGPGVGIASQPGTIASQGTGPQGGQFVPSGGNGAGGHYAPGSDTGSGGSGGQLSPGGSVGVQGPGGSYGGIGRHYSPGTGGQYGPGTGSNTGGQSGPGTSGTTGQYGGIGGQFGPGTGIQYGPSTGGGATGGPIGLGTGSQYRPGTGIGGQYGPGPGSSTGGQYGPGTGASYSPGTGTGKGGQYGPGTVSGTGGHYGPGTGIGTGGQYGPGTGSGGTGGQYGPGIGSGTTGQYGPGAGSGTGGHYGPVTGTGTGGQYGPGAGIGTGGHYGPGTGSGTGGQYGPGSSGTGGQSGPGTSGTGGQYGPGAGTGTGGHYGPGTGTGTGGQYGPGTGSGVTGGQYGPGIGSGTSGKYGPGTGTNTGGHYGPGAGTSTGGQYGPGTGSGVTGGQYGPGAGTGTGGQYGPGTGSGTGGQYGPDAGTGTGGQYGPGTGSGTGEQYRPGTGTGTDGQYGPGSSGNGGQSGPGTSGTGGQYGPGAGTGTGGQYGPGTGSGTSGQYGPTTGGGTGGQYGPGTGGGTGGQYGPGTGGGTGTQYGLGIGGQYGPGTGGGQYGPGTGGGTGGGIGGPYGPGTGSGSAGGQYPPDTGINNSGQFSPGTGGGYGGQLSPGTEGSGTVPGGQIGPGGSGGQVGPEAGTGLPGGSPFGPGGVGQYGPGTGGLYGPGTGGAGNQYSPGTSGQGTGEQFGPQGGQYGPGQRPGTPYNPYGPGGTDNLAGSGGSQNGGPPQNVVDPNSIADGDDSEAEASVNQAANGTVASASSKGGNDKGRAQTHVHGTYTDSGTFSAQAEITGEDKAASSQVTGNKKSASSTAQGSGRNNKSQANVELGLETGSVVTGSQSEGVLHSSNSQVQGSVKGGMADAQARGPGSTSSQAQIGFTPYKEGDKSHDLQKTPFIGGGISSAQSSGRTGMSQSQLHGTFKYGITYNGAAQAGSSLDKDAVFPNRLPFDKIDVNDRNNKNINVDNENVDNSEKNEYSPSTPQTEISPTELPFETDLVTELSKEAPVNQPDDTYGIHRHADHHTPSDPSLSPTRSPPVESRRSFQTTYPNNGDYEYTTDKDDTPPEDYDVDDGFGPEANYPAETEQSYINTSYNEFSREPEATHQSLHSPKRKGLDVRQTTGGSTQHILLGSLTDQDAEITQQNSERPDESRIYQPGERVPGTGGYTIPKGFTGSVKSVASKDNTYVVGSKESPSQAQTVSLTPGSGRVKYKYPPYVRNVNPKNLRSLYNSKSDDNNRYVSVSKSVTRALDGENNVRKQYSHTYYTKSSSCGYFTFTCTMVSGAEGRKKVCKPKMPTNSDGSPMRCN